MGQPVKKKEIMYDLLWIVNGRVKEVVMVNKPRYTCVWKANTIKGTTHRMGLLQPRRIDLRPKGGWR